MTFSSFNLKQIKIKKHQCEATTHLSRTQFLLLLPPGLLLILPPPPAKFEEENGKDKMEQGFRLPSNAAQLKPCKGGGWIHKCSSTLGCCIITYFQQISISWALSQDILPSFVQSSHYIIYTCLETAVWKQLNPWTSKTVFEKKQQISYYFVKGIKSCTCPHY